MRRNVLVSGIFITLLGLAFMAASGIAVQPEPPRETEVLDETTPDQPAYSLSVQGDLSNGDRFRVGFTVEGPPGALHIDAAVIVNVADPDGNNSTYEIPITLKGEQPIPTTPFPESTANKTGLYKVVAQGIWGVLLRSLVLEKMILKEPEYPYGILFPMGIAIMMVGIGVSFLGAKSSKPRRVLSKKRSLKRKP